MPHFRPGMAIVATGTVVLAIVDMVTVAQVMAPLTSTPVMAVIKTTMGVTAGMDTVAGIMRKSAAHWLLTFCALPLFLVRLRVPPSCLQGSSRSKSWRGGRRGVSHSHHPCWKVSKSYSSHPTLVDVDPCCPETRRDVQCRNLAGIPTRCTVMTDQIAQLQRFH